MRAKAKLFLVAVVAAFGLLGLQTFGNAADLRVPAQPEDTSSVVQVRARSTEGFEEHTINIGGLRRTYYLYVPSSLRGQLAPLVVAFHGGGGNPVPFASKTDLPEMAERYGYILVAPEGIEESWNTGAIIPQGYPEENGIDDLGFVNAMLDEVLALGIVDQSRLYAMGMSRGAMMAYNVACAMPGRFAAIATVAGTLSSGVCPDSRGTSLLHIHGTNDDRVPFEGGKGDSTSRRQSWASAAEGIQIFAQNGQCDMNFTSEQIGPNITCNRTDCPGSDEVEYCLIAGGGHEWPGKEPTKRKKMSGAAGNFNTTDFIAQFFQAH